MASLRPKSNCRGRNEKAGALEGARPVGVSATGLVASASSLAAVCGSRTADAFVPARGAAGIDMDVVHAAGIGADASIMDLASTNPRPRDAYQMAE